ncbi:MAG: DEAD/DEAH box helicase [Polyangiaceae bacterium]|nr:DEAD/DEAH box helicase [Polyangiaceae bacterium]
MRLRPYQQQAVQATVDHFRESIEPAVLVLPTGAGKSIVIAELARLAKGAVLVLAHVKELCEQNYAKYEALTAADESTDYGEAGLYSAGLGVKDAGQPVTFGSVQSVARNLRDFGRTVSLLVIDECHRVSGEDGSQYDRVIEHLRASNPKLKVLGLTATPYRLGMGWAYRYHYRGFARTDEERPFHSCIYEVSLREMIDGGYLTRPEIEDAPIAQYDFPAVGAGRHGGFAEAEVNALLVRHKRVTEAIVEQIVEIAERQDRQGVMIFAATVDHAREIAGYLPSEETALILGETPGTERDEQLGAFSARQLRYLVNVSVLTTGFDAPHVDLIAILRPTQSVSLFQQIVGRGLRLSPGKSDCLVVDYAGNGFDVFAPEIGEIKPTSDSQVVAVPCPICEYENEFWGQVDEDGQVFEHYGRRCQSVTLDESGKRQRCEYRFRFKECDRCGAENDIAARSCGSCERPLVDPDEQLKNALRLKDGLVLRVASMTLSQEGSRLKITYHDEDGTTLSERFDFANVKQRGVFNRAFGRRLASGRHPLELELAEQAIRLQGLLPQPDFVFARKQKGQRGRRPWMRVQTRVFDYEGRYRTAFL